MSLEVAPKVTADLVELGWVPAHVCGDKDVLAHALTELVERAIEARVTPALSSPGKVRFMLEIQHSTIETLVALGWLRADQRDDLGAIVTAFCRFAGRSLAVARNGKRSMVHSVTALNNSGAPPDVTRNSDSPYLHPLSGI